MKQSEFLLFLIFIPASSFAGKLDLPLYSAVHPKHSQPARQAPNFSLSAWKPGDPRTTRGESFAVQAVAGAGGAAVGLAGVAQNVGQFGRDRQATALSAGFGAIVIVNLWRSWRLWREQSALEQ